MWEIFNKLIKMWKIFNEYFIYSGLPSNISYAWNFGSLLGIVLIIQIISGVILGMHYCANIELSFIVIENIMRNVRNGFILRYMHSNGAAIFFILLYLHISRSIYNGSYSYPRHNLWNLGVMIYLISMATAFMGYCLVWGQLSIWWCNSYYKFCIYNSLFRKRYFNIIMRRFLSRKSYFK